MNEKTWAQLHCISQVTLAKGTLQFGSISPSVKSKNNPCQPRPRATGQVRWLFLTFYHEPLSPSHLTLHFTEKTGTIRQKVLKCTCLNRGCASLFRSSESLPCISSGDQAPSCNGPIPPGLCLLCIHTRSVQCARCWQIKCRFNLQIKMQIPGPTQTL